MTSLNKNNAKRFAAAIGLLIYAAGGSIASAASYKVEVLMFKHLDNQTQSIQVPLHYAKQPDTGGAVELSSESVGGYKLLSSGSHRLSGIKAELEKSGDYQIIKHLAWRQPGLKKSRSKPVHIYSGQDYSDQFPERMQSKWTLDDSGLPVNVEAAPQLLELDGTIKIALGRFFHIYTDLVYRQPTDIKSTLENQNVIESSLVDYKISGHRRMRSRELHYIDHPKVGILVQINPL